MVVTFFTSDILQAEIETITYEGIAYIMLTKANLSIISKRCCGMSDLAFSDAACTSVELITSLAESRIMKPHCQ